MPFSIGSRISLDELLRRPRAGWNIPRIVDRVYWAQARLAGLSEWSHQADGMHIHGWAGGTGSGHPLLLVHGFGGDALYGWIKQLPLAHSRFVVMPDLLWFGSVADRPMFSMVDQAEMLVQTLDHMGLDQVDVVGISYGGFVGLELAHGWSDRVRKLVLVDSPGHVYTLHDYHHMLERLGLHSVSELVVPEHHTGVKRLLSLAYHNPPWPVPAFVAKQIHEELFTQWTDEKVRLLDHMLQRASTIDANDYQLDVPCHVMWGEHDVLFPADLAYRLASALDCSVTLVPKTNHAPNMENPGFFNRHLLEFLDQDRP